MKILGKALIFFFLIIGASACNNNAKNNKSFLFTSVGKTSEALVVIDNDLWKSSIGDTIKSYLEEAEPWLVQSEPMYELSHIPESIFSDIYTKYRNILKVKISNYYEGNSIKIMNDVYAKPQVIIEIKCKNKADFYAYFAKENQIVISAFHKKELEKIKNVYNGVRGDSLSMKIRKKFNFKMVFPKGFYIAIDKTNFLWLREVSKDIEEGVFIYTKPYSDTMQFSAKSIIFSRDSITRAFVPGPLDNTFMKTSSVFPPYSESVDFKGNYATLLRSWWDVEGYAMGGPFISYTFVDTLANRLITLDGYVKAPKKDKRDILLHLEAIFDSFEMK